ncbi:MAG: insulinase family protein [Pyrinomonadaceae bacterium MAG19_C2-C3]|nr:insulinase family protein [Pyrinomonadaceae bacterium MAG19_C2-C3]
MKFPRACVVSHALTLALVASNLGGTLVHAQNSAPNASAASTVANVPLPQGVQRITSVEGITEYALPNGLRVLLFPDQSKQTITVNITYLVGSANENYGETGMAHLLEHLVFKGTPKHPNIPNELTEHGTRPNGTTFVDRTNYFETFAATDENLNWALDLESDRMVNSFIAKKDLDSEMTVVRNEFESGENNPFRVTLQRTLGSAYEWHNYGKSTIGSRADIENVPIDRLQAFYKKHYQPDNAVLLVAGKFDEAKTLELVNKYFAPIPRPTRTLQKLYTNEPTQDGERNVTVRRVGDIQLALAAYHVPSGAHADSAAAQIAAQALGDAPSGRLHKALVENKKAAEVVNLPFYMTLKEPGVAILGAVVPKEVNITEARDTMTATIEGIAATPLTKEEVERARTALLKEIDIALNSSANIGLEMSEWIAAGDWRLFFLNRDRIRSTTPEAVQASAVRYFKPANRTVGLFVPIAKPDRAEIPATPDVAALVRDYKGDAALSAGEAFDPSPENIESRLDRRNATANATGIRMVFLPKETRGDTVNAVLTLRFGDEKSLMNRSAAATLAGAMLERGTQKHTREQFKDELDKLKARVNIFGGATQATASIETTRANLPAVMRLVAEALREPSFPENEFNQAKQEVIASIEQQRSEPTAIAATEFQRLLSPYPKGDVRYVATPDESLAELKAVTLDDVKKFYKDFYGASNAELAVVGDFDKEETAKLANELFGSFKSPRPFTRVPRPFQDVASTNKSFETPDKANGFFIAGLNLKVRDDNPDFAALSLGNYMLGGGFLNSRLAARIRGKEGLSYGVGSRLNASSLDENGSFTTTAIYAPQNVTRLEAVFKEEIARALKDGFTAEEVEAAKKGFLQSRQVSRAQDNELVGRLGNYLFINRTLAFDLALDKQLQALTPEQINAAMRKYITPDKITIIKAGDFAKK